MTWLTWRQHRLSLLAGLATLVVFGAVLILTGLSMRNGFDRLGLDRCAAPIDTTCSDAAHQFTTLYGGSKQLLPLLFLLPALVGVFWGAPLVAREIEQGTHRLAWLQSVSRARWLLVKVLVLAGAVIVGIGAFTWLLHWWVQPFMEVHQNDFELGMFDLLGVVPIAYALAALAMGVVAGSVTKKVLPAVALTLVLFAGVRVVVDVWARPSFMTPIDASFAMPNDAGAAPLPEGWYLVQQTVDRDGNVMGQGVGFERDAVARACPEAVAQFDPPSPSGEAVQRVPGGRLDAIQACATRLGFRVQASYQPEDRFWRFQITEALLYVALTGALLAASVWWIRNKVP